MSVGALAGAQRPLAISLGDKVVIEEIPEGAVARIARKVFGARTQVNSVAWIMPVSEYGIWKISGCNANLSYVVALRDHSQKYVFRFNRGFREDLFDKEVRNYQTIADRTDIPTPKIYCVDRSNEIVPTSYLVMDYMVGDEGTFLSHPNNPDTDEEEKDEIQRQMGHYCAQVHNITRKATEADAEAQKLLGRLEQLEHVVEDGQYCIEPERIGLCRRAVAKEHHLLLETASLCMADSELHFVKVNGRWQVSFICDMEWVDFGDPYSDLVIALGGRMGLLDLDYPLGVNDVSKVSGRSFFKGYQDLRRIDYERLDRVATYTQLGLWCSIADQVYRPESRGYMKSREPIIATLVEVVAERALA
jgi:aminoglycoside phosphotransferase (APT) family kinase protein